MGFKIGDKVVYTGGAPDAATMRLPEVNTEIVTIKGYCDVYNNSYDIEGYEVCSDGIPQSINGKRLRKVEPKKETVSATFKILKEFRESEIIKEVDVIEKPSPVIMQNN